MKPIVRSIYHGTSLFFMFVVVKSTNAYCVYFTRIYMLLSIKSFFTLIWKFNPFSGRFANLLPRTTLISFKAVYGGILHFRSGSNGFSYLR